jgi:3-oxoadipate enol-lactonase
MEALVDQTMGRWFPAETIAANPPFIGKVRNMIRTTPVNGFTGCAAALSDFDFRAGLGAMKLPTLLIVGTRDATVSGIKAINAGIPGSKLVELEGAGHLSNLDAAAGFTRAVRDFLAE